MKANAFRFWSPYLFIFFSLWLAALALQPQPLDLLKENWSFIFLGFFGALLGNLTAVGGGIVFIPAMLFIYHLPPVQALKVALVSQSFGMTSGAIAWLQRGVVPLKSLKMTIPPLILGSCLSSFLMHPNGLIIKLLFGPVSIALGILTLKMIQQKKTANELQEIPPQASLSLAVTAFFGGVITGWIAIGEGEMVAALLMLVYFVRTEVAIGLGVVLLSVNSLFLTFLHQFAFDGIPWSIGIFTGLGTVFGARLAPFLSWHMSSRTLKMIFASLAILDGLLFVFQYIIKTYL